MNPSDEHPNQFRQPSSSAEEPMGRHFSTLPEPERELPAKTLWQNATLIGLGVLLIIGGIALGLRSKDNGSEIVDLPEYTPIEASASPGQSPDATQPSPSEEAQPSAAPVASSQPSVAQSKPAKIAYKPRSVAKAVAKTVIAPASAPLNSPLSEYSPVYQALVALPEYSPQFSSPTPSPKITQSVRLVAPGCSYTVEITGTISVANLMQAARSQGFSYETRQYSFGSLVTTINGQSESSGRYWTFTKNGAFSQLGIDEQTVGNGDVIVWSLAAI